MDFFMLFHNITIICCYNFPFIIVIFTYASYNNFITTSNYLLLIYKEPENDRKSERNSRNG